MLTVLAFCYVFFSYYIQPKTYIPGQHGESRSLVLELKIIADVGLVGFPNVRCVYLSYFIGYKVFANHYSYSMISDLTLFIIKRSGGEIFTFACVVQRRAESGELSVHHFAPLSGSGRVLGK